MAYKVIASKEVEEAIDNIHDYIATVLLSPQSAKNTVAKILDSLKSLEIFPEAGFDADEKIGVKINSKYPSRGKIIDQYVLLYFIDQNRNTVFYLTYSTLKVTTSLCYKKKIKKGQILETTFLSL